MAECQFISGKELNPSQLEVVAQLLCETGYYDLTSQGNQLNLPTLEFQKKQTLKFHEKYTQVLVKDKRIAGFFIAETKDQYLEAEKLMPNWHKRDPKLKAAINKIVNYYQKETLCTDLILYAIALAPEFRGQGLFHQLMAQLKTIAQKEHCTRIAFATWESNKAVSMYQHCGAKITGAIDLRDSLFQERLLTAVFNL